MYVSIIGGQDCEEDILMMAEQVGRRVADMGAVLITGGLGGVMKAASKGAREMGGVVLGILPGNDRSVANEYCTHVIVTGLNHLRNALIVQNADIVIAIDGGYGTLSEIAIAKLYNKQVYGLHTWDVGIHMSETVDQLFSNIKSDVE
jgi:uncharacterized protein (TIGR00725 family)